MNAEQEHQAVLVSTAAQREAVYAIRRESFPVDETEPGGGNGVSDDYDDQPNTFTYLLQSAQGDAVGTIRSSVYAAAFAWQRIPALDLFGNQIQASLPLPATIVQSSLFAIAAQHRGIELLPKLLLIRELFRTAVAWQAERIVTVVRNWPSQLRFYARLGLFPVGPAKRHPWAQCESVLLAAHPQKSLQIVRESKLLWPIGAFDDRSALAANVSSQTANSGALE